MEKVNFETITEEEIIKVAVEEEQLIFRNLNRALENLKGFECNVYVAGGIMVEHYYEKFDFSCFPNCKGQLLLDLKENDDDSDEKPSITLKLDDIVFINIDDNSEEISLKLMDEYSVEDIELELQSGLSVRIEKQW